jgi:hypothetical protein
MLKFLSLMSNRERLNLIWTQIKSDERGYRNEKHSVILLGLNQRASALIRVPLDVDVSVSYVESRIDKPLSGRGSNLMIADYKGKNIRFRFDQRASALIRVPLDVEILIVNDHAAADIIQIIMVSPRTPRLRTEALWRASATPRET